MPALVLGWLLVILAGCPSGLPRPDPVPIDTDAPTDTDPEVPRRPVLEAEIVYPAHGDVFEVDETVYLEGEARLDGVRISGAEFRWTSSRDGFLGEDAQVPWRPTSPGRHVIELEVELGSADDRDQIDVEVRPW